MYDPQVNIANACIKILQPWWSHPFRFSNQIVLLLFVHATCLADLILNSLVPFVLDAEYRSVNLHSF